MARKMVPPLKWILKISHWTRLCTRRIGKLPSYPEGRNQAWRCQTEHGHCGWWICVKVRGMSQNCQFNGGKIGEMTMNNGIWGVQMLRPPRFKQTSASLLVVRFHHVSPTSTANLRGMRRRNLEVSRKQVGFTQKLDNLSIPGPILCTILMLFSSDLGPLFSHHN